MPVLNIGVSRPGSNAPSATVTAIVDTGADGALIPRDTLEHTGAPFIDHAYLRGVTGQRQLVDMSEYLFVEKSFLDHHRSLG